MAVNTAIFHFRIMKISYLLCEDETELAQREAVMDSVLLRGVTRPLTWNVPFVKIPIRTDRKPRDSTAMGTTLFNAAMETAHGVKDIRAKSLFATTDVDVATEYASTSDYRTNSETGGEIVRVLPLKSAKIAFNPKYNDSWKAIEDMEIACQKAGVDLKKFFTHDGQLVNNTTDSLAVIKFLMQQLPPEEQAKAKAGFDAAVQIARGYTVTSATQSNHIPDSTEVMVFDAPYYYATESEYEPYDPYD